MNRKIVIFLIALIALSVFVNATDNIPVTSINVLLNCQLNEVKAGIKPKRTSALKDIKTTLKNSDNYVDLDYALSEFKKFINVNKKSYSSLAPVSKILLDKIDYASVTTKIPRTKDRTEFKKIYSKLSKSPIRHGFVLDGPKTKKWKPVIISFKDKKSKRRVKLLQDMIQRHNGNFVVSYSYTKDGEDMITNNYLIEGNGKFVSKIAEYYSGKLPSKPLSVKLVLKSGSLLNKISSSLTIKAPSDLDTIGGFNWIKTKIVSGVWKYIYNNYPETFNKHKTEKDGQWRIKNGEIQYTITYPAEFDIVLSQNNIESGTEYFNKR